MNAYKIGSYIAFIFFIIAIVLIAYGITDFVKRKDFEKKAIITTGVVYDFCVTPPYKQALVEFTAQDGTKVIFVDKLFWNAEFNTYIIGQEVEVIYDPADPYKTAYINGFFQKNIAIWWPIILGIISVIAGIIMRISMLKKSKMFEDRLSGKTQYDPEYYRKGANKVALIMFISVIIMVLLLVLVFGFCGKVRMPKSITGCIENHALR